MIWNKNTIQQYITDEVEENLTLEYKGSGSLAKDEKSKNEITKDVSAMANSAGGILIYGIGEYDKKLFPDKASLPGKLEPIDRKSFSKDTLTQIINNIQPHIDGVIVHSITIDSALNKVVYVIEIPQSNTAHQATDGRYYKRSNAINQRMEDYEIRDIMNRIKHPKIDLSFEFVFSYIPAENQQKIDELHIWRMYLRVTAKNNGPVYAQYVNCVLKLPGQIVHYEELIDDMIDRGEQAPFTPEKLYLSYNVENTVRDKIGDSVDTSNNFEYIYPQKQIYGPTRYVPLLPGMTLYKDIEINQFNENSRIKELFIEWEIYADNSIPKTGKFLIADIKRRPIKPAKPINELPLINPI